MFVLLGLLIRFHNVIAFRHFINNYNNIFPTLTKSSNNNDMAAKNPLVVIIGPTATGKTKFSIDLSKKLKESGISSEIVNCDSMQVYKGFPIGTDQPKPEELTAVKHHLFNMIEIDQVYNASRYANDSISLIDKLHASNILPIVVGGTNLYVESLLWPSFLNQYEPIEFEDDYDDLSTDELYKKLNEVDPERAVQLHKNDRKRIIRSLLLWDNMRVKHSELLNDEKTRDTLRYNTVIFYIDCDAETHSERILNRVNYMIDNGIVEEAILLYKLYLNHTSSKSGIFQSIAYKEIFPFIREGADVKSQEIIDKIREILVSKTKSYSRRQRTWIKNKFEAKDLNIIKFNSTDMLKFPEFVIKASEIIINLFLNSNSSS